VRQDNSFQRLLVTREDRYDALHSSEVRKVLLLRAGKFLFDFLDSLNLGGRLSLKIALQPSVHEPFCVLFSHHTAPRPHLAIIALRAARPNKHRDIPQREFPGTLLAVIAMPIPCAHENRAFVLAVGYRIGNLKAMFGYNDGSVL
jgi:hypothetical protein